VAYTAYWFTHGSHAVGNEKEKEKYLTMVACIF
jgi:hypothetical protein